MDSDFKKALQTHRDYDGGVDAFGAGGTKFFLQVGKQGDYFRDIERAPLEPNSEVLNPQGGTPP